VAIPIGVLAILVDVVGGRLLPDGALPGWVTLGIGMGGVALLVGGLLLTFLPFAPRVAPLQVASPVAGRWVALNSPASGAPSHGTHGYGQTYAVDLVFEPAPGARPAFGAGPGFRPPADFPAFGQPVRAPAGGRVVTVRRDARDHRSRSSWPALAWMLLEGALAELTGPGGLLGNHVVLDLGGGAYAVLAHLQHGSVAVTPGQRVHQGDLLGRCGNSGNSSEPHLHFQLMDHPRVLIAAGLPFAFTGVRLEGAGAAGVPANRQAMLAPEGGTP
jgi:murein DD-endopeptidase MepM/ murein hydrolase activator NlpD